MDAPTFDLVRQVASGRWATEILPALGVELILLDGKHHACPGCGGEDRFRFDDKNGNGTWICGGKGDTQSGDGFGLLTHIYGWSNKQALRRVAILLGVVGMTLSPEDRAAIKEKQRVAQIKQRDLKLLSLATCWVLEIQDRLHRAYLCGLPPIRTDEKDHKGVFQSDFSADVVFEAKYRGYHPEESEIKLARSVYAAMTERYRDREATP